MNPREAAPTAREVAELADELAAIRRRVTNVVGHELRTPVTTIHGLAEELVHADSLTTVNEIIAPALLRNTARLSRLLDDLLIASGVQTAIPVENSADIEVTSLVREVWDNVGIGHIVVNGGPAIAHAPVAGLRRTMEAVLANASAYGADAPTVTVVSSGGRVSISVLSPGPQLHPDEVRMATEPFFRGERAVTTQPGLGVGLAIAQAIVQRAGGMLAFKASEVGTETTIDLPEVGAP